jgi:hypothetical protein
MMLGLLGLRSNFTESFFQYLAIFEKKLKQKAPLRDGAFCFCDCQEALGLTVLFSFFGY